MLLPCTILETRFCGPDSKPLDFPLGFEDDELYSVPSEEGRMCVSYLAYIPLERGQTSMLFVFTLVFCPISKVFETIGEKEKCIDAVIELQPLVRVEITFDLI